MDYLTAVAQMAGFRRYPQFANAVSTKIGKLNDLKIKANRGSGEDPPDGDAEL